MGLELYEKAPFPTVEQFFGNFNGLKAAAESFNWELKWSEAINQANTFFYKGVPYSKEWTKVVKTPYTQWNYKYDIQDQISFLNALEKDYDSQSAREASLTQSRVAAIKENIITEQAILAAKENGAKIFWSESQNRVVYQNGEEYIFTWYGYRGDKNEETGQYEYPYNSGAEGDVILDADGTNHNRVPLYIYKEVLPHID